jgi:hypothetical protein
MVPEVLPRKVWEIRQGGCAAWGARWHSRLAHSGTGVGPPATRIDGFPAADRNLRISSTGRPYGRQMRRTRALTRGSSSGRLTMMPCTPESERSFQPVELVPEKGTRGVAVVAASCSPRAASSAHGPGALAVPVRRSAKHPPSREGDALRIVMRAGVAVGWARWGRKIGGLARGTAGVGATALRMPCFGRVCPNDASFASWPRGERPAAFGCSCLCWG